MGAAIRLRTDYDGATLRRSARTTTLTQGDDAQRHALAAIVESGPNPSLHAVVRWRLSDLAQWLQVEFGVLLHETSVSRELKALGYVKLTARPRHHAQDTDALGDFKKRASQPSWKRCAQASCKPL